MKKLALVLIAILFAVTGVLAQTPNQFKYQAVLRDAGGVMMANQAVTVDISILQGSASGTSVFSESHSVTTTAQGLINLNIGSISDLSTVDFSANTYFVEITVNGTVMGTSQLLSVPYALTAKNVENDQVDDADADPNNELQDLTLNGTTLEISGGANADLSSLQDGTGTDDQTLAEVLTQNNSAGNANITNLADPVNDQDAATKVYIDHKFDMLSIANQGVTDIDGNQYNAVLIGNQIWMAEDLKVIKYPNGDAIPNVTDNTAWANLADDDIADAYCFYNNDNTTDYGALYTYAAAIGDNWARDNTANQGLCPDGWHLPTDAEWKELEMYLGMSQTDADLTGWRGTDEGGKMKETGTTHWNSPNTGATNSSGFSAFSGGYHHGNYGSFESQGILGDFWSATENSTETAWYRILYNNSSDINRNNYNKSYGFSVRCLRD